jgi:endonuclease/exonuclease/phosphatase family metal-dependent hydrolase
MIVTNTPDIQNPVASDQIIDIKIIENSQKNINNISHLKIATFNVGDFSGKDIDAGSDDAKIAYRQVIAKIGANIIATQEDNRYFNNTTKEPTQTALFDCFRYYFRSEIGNTPDANVNTYGLCSDYFIENVRNVIFKFPYNTARFTHKFSQCGELVIDGKRVLLCNIHLDWDDTAIRREQISQLISYCSNYENVIILGDTNPDNYVDGELVQPYHPYEEEWAIFASAGYDLANGGYLGYFDTCDAGGDNWYPVDNIFTKGNIKIKNSYTITEEWMNDHKPVIVELVIY